MVGNRYRRKDNKDISYLCYVELDNGEYVFVHETDNMLLVLNKKEIEESMIPDVKWLLKDILSND